MKLPTKYFSTKQENLIALTLGWKVVSGSGSRDFNPGDIESDTWLGECKTHTAIKSNIIFQFNHWSKICEESKSKFKYGVLFVDDGSQTLDNTYCLFDPNLQDLSDFEVIKVSNQYKNQINVKKDKLKQVLSNPITSIPRLLLFNLHGSKVCVCKFEAFQKLTSIE